MLRFLSDESGAVTVDWVVLGGAIVGLGLATTAVVSAGVESLSSDTAQEMAGTEIRTAFGSFTIGDDFAGGLGNWVGGMLDSSAAYGSTLRGGGTGGLQGARAVYDIQDDMAFAVMTFDMHAVDSWDGETFSVFANDEVVANVSFHQDVDGSNGSWVSDNPDMSFSMAATTPRGHQGHVAGWSDQSFQMQVTVANPGDEVSLGFGSSLDQSVGDESWAVDNVQVTATNRL